MECAPQCEFSQVGEFVVVVMVVDGLVRTPAEGLVALYLHLRRYGGGGLVRAVEKNLQMGFRDDAGAVDQRVADLNRAFTGGGVVCL